MKNGLIYARVSTEEQARNGQSIESQLRICQKFAQDNDIQIIQSFLDEGKSATNMNRPALKDMLALVMDKDQHINVILVQDTDRLARNTIDHLQIKAILRKQEVQLISVSQPIIDDSPEGNLIDTLLAATNAFQSQITGRKTSKVMEQKALAGWSPSGNPPLGYMYADNPAPTSTLDRRIVILHPTDAPIIREMFQMYATGKYSTADIANYLNEKNVKPHYGKKIHVSVVVNSLRNPYYIGFFRWKKVVHEGKHEKLIDKTLFDQVQMVMDAHNQGASRKRKHNFLLRGFVFCKDCGSRYWGEQRLKGGKLYQHYFCKSCVRGSYVEIETLEKEVERKIAQIEISDEYKRKVLELAAQIIEESRSSRDSEKRRLEKEQSSLEKALRDAEDDRYIHHTITGDDFNRLSDRYKISLGNVRNSLEKLDIDHSEKLRALENILSLAENIVVAYKKADPEMKREYLGLFFSKFIVKDKKIVSFVLAPEVKDLIAEGSVRVRTKVLPDLDSNQDKQIQSLLAYH